MDHTKLLQLSTALHQLQAVYGLDVRLLGFQAYRYKFFIASSGQYCKHSIACVRKYELDNEAQALTLYLQELSPTNLKQLLELL